MLFCFNYRAGMFVYGLAFLIGVVLLQQCSVLPSKFFVFSPFIILLSFTYLLFKTSFSWVNYFTGTYLKVILVFLLLSQVGFVVAYLVGEKAISHRLDDTYTSINILIKGTVSSIPVTNGKSQRFEFTVNGYYFIDGNKQLSDSKFPKKLRLSWYLGSSVNADERWQFVVRLKPPHGFMNPGGFDYEKWLFQKGISATGYVTKSNENKLLQRASVLSINRFRQSLSFQLDQIEEASENSTLAMVKALAIGEKSSMTDEQWQVLTNTGTSHLMAISGLHIGLAALFANFIVRRCVPVVAIKYVPAQHVAIVAGMIMALLYALVAGLSVPTQRALIMLVVLSLFFLFRRNYRPLDILGLALVAILLFDPLVVLSAGFWFSFSAVAIIFISVVRGVEDNDVLNAKITLRVKVITILRRWVHLQVVLSIFLLPLSLFMFQQVSLVSSFANLLLIPYVSFFVVPVVLLAILFTLMIPVVSDVLFELAAQMLEIIWPVLSFLSSQPFSIWKYEDLGVIELFVTTLILVILYFSKQLSKKISISFFYLWLIRLFLSLVLMSCLIRFINASEVKLKKGEMKMTVLDVGQGSSAVIQTQHHVLVFDAGAKFSNKLNSGKSVIIPYLRSEGINNIDTLVISHGDADHIGGAQSLIDEYPDINLIGQDIDLLKYVKKEVCHSGIEWQWDGVTFKFLSPILNNSQAKTMYKQSRNNRSCVLQVSSHLGSILLTGDIEKTMEQTLLKIYGSLLDSDVLVVPHHGSDTSSTMPFITTVDPKLSIISVGYKNRYHLPNHRVIQRYNDFYEGLNNRVLQTYSSGAISVTLKRGLAIQLEQFREQTRKYWHN